MIFWKHILEKVASSQKVYLLTVIENHGSSPGRKGFKMLVSDDGFIYGSVGGGVMEFTLVEEALDLLKKEKSPIFIKKQIHRGKIKDGSGMICSGEQTVAFHSLDSSHTRLIQEILTTLENGERGTLSLKPDAIEFYKNQVSGHFDYNIHSVKDWYFKEALGYRDTLYIVGGGHVGVAVSELFSKLGFYVIVLDNRDNLNTLENNNFADKKIVIDYNDILNHVKEGSHSYIAIMTNKYTDDKIALSKIIRNNYKFIGVLGSKAKLKTMWKVMKTEGYTKEELDNIYAPIGLSIKSETPEEIAVSIAAQIIQIKNTGKL